MGILYHVTCSNKECRYSAELREGPGIGNMRRMDRIEEQIRNGEISVSDKIIELLNAGEKLDCVTPFLCPICREFQTNDELYIFEPINVSPYGTIRDYKLHYVFGKPKCSKCGFELIHILNPRSSKTKCPKCGTDHMKVSRISSRQ